MAQLRILNHRTRLEATLGDFVSQRSPRNEMARALLALADPIRLRMLNLMLAGELSPAQLAQCLGVQEKIISRYLMLFREGKIVIMRTKRNVKFYTIRSDPEFKLFRFLRTAIKMIEHDAVLKADLAVFHAGGQESRSWTPADEDRPAHAVRELQLGF